MTSDLLQPLDVPGKSFRSSLMWPTEETGWSCSRTIYVKHVPNVYVRHPHTHGYKFDEEMDGIDDQSLNACLHQLFWQLLQCYPAALVGQRQLVRIACLLLAMALKIKSCGR